MRVVFMGTPDFAVPTLNALTAAHEVVAVYSRPDRPAGRGRHLAPTAVKSAALEAGLRVRQPARLGDADELALLCADRPDVIVVAAFGAILPQAVLDIPVHGCLNVHASLLPRWRGAAPIQRAILAGDRETGVSIMRMEAGLDTGPWCSQGTVDLEGRYAAEVEADLAECGAGLLIEALPRLADGSLIWREQDESLVTYAAKVTAADVAVRPEMSVTEFLARVRASGPSAPCRASIEDRNVTILRASASPVTVAPGAAECAFALELGCSDGAVRLDEIVPEGRKPMSGESFARGARFPSVCTWRSR